MLKQSRSRSAELQARVYEILEQGPVGEPGQPRRRPAADPAHRRSTLICAALESVPALRQPLRARVRC